MFVNSLGKITTGKARAGAYPRLRLGDLGAAAARRNVVTARRMKLGGLPLGDLGKAAARSTVPSVMRRTRLRGLEDVTCTPDPVTGSRVCTSPVGSGAAASPSPVISLPPQTFGVPFAGSPPPSNVVGAAPPAGFPIVIDPTTGIPFWREYPVSALNLATGYPFGWTMPTTSITSPAPGVTAAGIPQVVDPTTGILFTQEYPASSLNPVTGYPYGWNAGTIQPVSPYAPSNYVTSQPGANTQGSGTLFGVNKNYLAIGGLVVGSLVLLKMMGVFKR